MTTAGNRMVKNSPAPRDAGMLPYLSVYRSGTRNYLIYAGRKKDVEAQSRRLPFSNLPISDEMFRNLKLIARKRIPDAWGEEMLGFIREYGYRGGVAPLGFILYMGDSRRAWSANYYPKDEPLRRGLAKGIAYYIEAVIVKRMQLDGVESVSSSDEPSAERAGQLMRVGLPINKPVEISEWLRKLGRGIRYHTDRAGKKEGGCGASKTPGAKTKVP